VINQRIDHIKRLFKWAVSEELVPPSVYEALKNVAGLRRGHPGTRETQRVKPVPQLHVDAALPFLAPQVAAMVQLQPLMGARETEICTIRGRDIDMSGPVWWYLIDPNEVPPEGRAANQHKTAHHEDAGGQCPGEAAADWSEGPDDPALAASQPGRVPFPAEGGKRSPEFRKAEETENALVAFSCRSSSNETKDEAETGSQGALRPAFVGQGHRKDFFP